MKCRLWIAGQLEVVAGDFDDDDEEDESDFESDDALSPDELDFSDFSEELGLSLEPELSEPEPSELDDELALELLPFELLAASRLSLR
jgi:hypothetical protein